MAEAFARTYGSDVLEAASAGMAYGLTIPASTYDVMQEKNIGLVGHFPKRMDELTRKEYDLIINMSGYRLPPYLHGTVEEWEVVDPMGLDADVFRQTRDDIENRVMRLILKLRRDASVAGSSAD